jgi:hypothetical protein
MCLLVIFDLEDIKQESKSKLKIEPNLTFGSGISLELLYRRGSIGRA